MRAALRCLVLGWALTASSCPSAHERAMAEWRRRTTTCEQDSDCVVTTHPCCEPGECNPPIALPVHHDEPPPGLDDWITECLPPAGPCDARCARPEVPEHTAVCVASHCVLR